MRIILTGGGTAGHINPAIAIGKKIMKENPSAEILYVGTQRGLESELVPKAGFTFESITVKGFRRRLSMDTFKSIIAMFKGLIEAQRIMKSYKPDMVIGTGGYVCGPVVFMAALNRIPTLIHEQNAYPGATNRILSHVVKKIMISYTESSSFFKQNQKIVYTGNPVRQEFVGVDRQKSRSDLGIDDGQTFLLSFGGSGGADRMNRTFMEMIGQFNGASNIRLCHVAGKAYYEKFVRQVRDLYPNLESNVEIVPYLYDMHTYMGASDLVISRAGAISLAEIATIGVPSVLIPSPNVANNHQVFNARVMKEHKAALMIEEKDLDPIGLASEIKRLMDETDTLDNMRENTIQLSMAEAIERIYETIIQVVS